MWENQFSEHQIRERIEVVATGLQGQGLHKIHVFSQTPVSIRFCRVAKPDS